MERETLLHILDIQDRAIEDAEYRQLAGVFHQLNDQLLELIAALPEMEQNLFWDYIATGAEMHQKLMEMATKFKL